MWSPSLRRASPSLWRRCSPRKKGALGLRTAAMTFAVLEVLTLREPLSRALARTRPRTRNGLAVATLGGATLGFLKARLERHLRRRSRRSRHWDLRTPVETALAAALLGALALPLMMAPPPEQALRKGTAPRPPPGPPGPAARSIADDDDDWDDLDLEGAIASW